MSWKPVDLSDVVEGLVAGTLELPAPTVGSIEGGTALFYPGTINGIAGESGSGKSWTALACCAQEIAREQTVVFIDYEDNAESVVGRLLALGTDPHQVLGCFDYINPGTRFDQAAADSLSKTLCIDDPLFADMRPSLVVIDSTGEALAMDGANPNADEEVAAWFGKVRWIAAKSGAAVVVLDHTTKVSGNDGMWPIGSQRKRAAITGAQYMQRASRPFSRTQAGSAKLVCAKDRHGHYSMGQHVADLVVTPNGEQIALSLRAATRVSVGEQAWRPTGYMEKVSRALELATEALSGNGVCERVSGKKGYVLTALSMLVAEGYIATAPGPRNSTLHTSVKPYREAEDEREPVEADIGPPTGSTGSGSLGGEPGTSDGSGSGNQSGTSREPVESATPECVVCGQPLLLTLAGRDVCERCHVARERAS